MLHVAHPVPATWRGGTTTAVAARVELHARAVRLYRRLTDAPGIMSALRAMGAKVLARFWKARSETQTPSAWERLGEDLIALRCAGVPPHVLRIASVELEAVVEDLDPAPTTEARVLEAVQVAQEAEAHENAAETALLCRADRAVTAGDLDRLIEAKEAEIAADREVITQARKLRTQLRAARLGLRVARGESR